MRLLRSLLPFVVDRQDLPLRRVTYRLLDREDRILCPFHHVLFLDQALYNTFQRNLRWPVLCDDGLR